MKKEYIAPDAFVVEMKQQNSILAGSGPYNDTDGNGGFNNPTGGNVPPRGRAARFDDFDWEE